jgi:hypothetical protein
MTTLVSRAKTPINQFSVTASQRSRFVVTRLLGQVWKRWRRCSPPNRSQRASPVSQQCLHYRQRHHLGVTDPWSDTHPGALRNTLGKAFEKVIGPDIQSGSLGVPLSVHDELSPASVVSQPLSIELAASSRPANIGTRLPASDHRMRNVTRVKMTS